MLKYINGDEEFPNGVHFENFDEHGNLTNDLRADRAYYFVQEKKWRGQGHVVVKNIIKNEELQTEELFWKQDTRKIFTEKFVTLKLNTEILYGTGLDADQDLSYYKITKPEGEFDVDE